MCNNFRAFSLLSTVQSTVEQRTLNTILPLLLFGVPQHRYPTSDNCYSNQKNKGGTEEKPGNSARHARKRTLNIYTSFYGQKEPRGAGTRPQPHFHQLESRNECNHIVSYYGFNGNDNCQPSSEKENREETKDGGHSQVNRRIWLRSTEAIKFSFVTRNFSLLPAAKCQHMQKTKFQRPSHKKKIKIKENKKDKNNNINGEKMRKDNEEKSREKSA